MEEKMKELKKSFKSLLLNLEKNQSRLSDVILKPIWFYPSQSILSNLQGLLSSIVSYETIIQHNCPVSLEFLKRREIS